MYYLNDEMWDELEFLEDKLEIDFLNKNLNLVFAIVKDVSR